MKTPAPSVIFRAVPALVLVSLTFALTSCSSSRSVPCSAELACPEGWACSADGQTCIQTLCGDSVQQSGEACDDGNNVSGDGCNSTCTSNEQCGNGYIDAELGEQCDDGDQSNDNDCLNTCKIASCGDGYLRSQSTAAEACDYADTSSPCNLNCTQAQCGDGLVSANEECDSGLRENTDKCNANCTVPRCGDGIVNPAVGEECDNGTGSDTADCLSTCKKSRCGDGYVNPLTELCDDGNDKTETSCAYGTQSCQVCNSSCTALEKRKGSYCGDKVQDPGEACDDGNAIEETECSRDIWSCTACSADCSKTLSLSGTVCGNGAHEWGEGCDDGNTESCGSCNAYCTSKVSQTRAKGSIKAINAVDLQDGETFTINDGIHVPVVFEFNKVNGTSSGHIAIDIQDAHTAENVAEIIADVIDTIPNATLAINATRSGSLVKLEHVQTGGTGNQTIVKAVSHPSFSVTGMSGGSPYGCAEGIGCVNDSDCAPGLGCVNKHCTEI